METENSSLPDAITSRELGGLKKEIERKFLLKSIPENLKNFPHQKIKQGYIAASDDIEIRLRKKGNKFFQTVKMGTGGSRPEIEKEVTVDFFNSFWPTTEGKRVEKTRYEIPNSAGKIELDIYEGDHLGEALAEVEFENENDREKFVPPDWFGEEVTDDKRYKNQNLAIFGFPRRAVTQKEKSAEDYRIMRLELEPGVRKLAALIERKMSDRPGPVVVEVAGGSASGKTSAVAEKIKNHFGDEALIFSMDDYYRGVTFMEAQAAAGNKLNWDQPEALNLKLLKEHLAKLKSGEAIKKPIYSMKTGEPSGNEIVQPRKIIIVEGLFALNEELKGEGDVKAFVDIGIHGRILRRLLRDIERTGNKPQDILKYFSEIVQPMHDKYIESTKNNSDLIIENEYSPKVESERSGLHEVQIKFAGKLDPGAITKLGGERLVVTNQVDNYYNPKDRNLVETGEILRIREEGDSRLITYKGPKIETENYRERPKFEFEIDKDTEKAFLSIYGDKKKVISKKRTLYQLDGVVFSVDDVTKREEGKTTDLGSFVEIRTTDKDINLDKIKKVIEKLGLQFENRIKKSYFEM